MFHNFSHSANETQYSVNLASCATYYWPAKTGIKTKSNSQQKASKCVRFPFTDAAQYRFFEAIEAPPNEIALMIALGDLVGCGERLPLVKCATNTNYTSVNRAVCAPYDSARSTNHKHTKCIRDRQLVNV